MPKKSTKKRGPGRPIEHVPTPQLLDKIEALAQLGCPRGELAWLVDIPRRSFTRMQHDERVSDAIARGKAKRRLLLRQAQWDTAVVDRHPTMQIWLGTQDLGQREPQQRVQQDVNVSGDVTQMSREQLQAIIRKADEADGKYTSDNTEH
jgi:hypothetical protein